MHPSLPLKNYFNDFAPISDRGGRSPRRFKRYLRPRARLRRNYCQSVEKFTRGKPIVVNSTLSDVGRKLINQRDCTNVTRKSFASREAPETPRETNRRRSILPVYNGIIPFERRSESSVSREARDRVFRGRATRSSRENVGGLVASRPICFRDVEKRWFLSDGSLLGSTSRATRERAAEEQRGFCDKDVSGVVDRPSNENFTATDCQQMERKREREWNSFYKRITAETDSRKYLQKAFANVLNAKRLQISFAPATRPGQS